MLSVLLLLAHLSMLGVCARAAIVATKRRLTREDPLFLGASHALSPHYIIYTLFVSNFVGICFSRTLHYQFYSWYFHSLPYLLWTTIRESNARVAVRVLLLVGVEGAFLTFPATPTSSGVIQFCHLMILAAVLVHGFPSPVEPSLAKSPGRTGLSTPTKKRV
jgi:alpha-1,3-mannosyltransferase